MTFVVAAPGRTADPGELVHLLQLGPQGVGEAADRGLGAQPRIAGSARLLGPASFAMGVILCSPTVGVHGFDTENRRWDVLVPAGTSSTFSLDVVPAASSPWPDTDYDVVFEAQPDLVGSGRGTLPAAQRVTVRGPRPIGARGVHLTLHSTPRTVPAGRFGAARVRNGSRIAIRGTTRPKLAHTPVSLWTCTSAKPSFRRAHTVRTGRRGRFRATVRARPGLQVMARIRPPRPDYTPDYSCPLAFAAR